MRLCQSEKRNQTDDIFKFPHLSRSLEIVKGRHPTVETALLHQNREFTANSVTFRHPHDDHLEGDTAFEPSFIHVLTGPVSREFYSAKTLPPREKKRELNWRAKANWL